LSAHLPQLAYHADVRVAGATGELRLDGDGVVQRTPAWLTFRRGEVVVLEQE